MSRTYGGSLVFVLAAFAIGLVWPEGWQPWRSLAATTSEEMRRTPIVTVREVRQGAELAVVDMTPSVEFTKHRFPARWRDYLGLDEETTMVVYATVKAGFDLSQMSEDDLWTDGDRVQLHLPAPQILSTTIDWSHTYVVDHDKSIFLKEDPNFPVAVLKEGTDLIEEHVRREGILNVAEAFGRSYYDDLFQKLGFEKIRIGIN